MRNADFQVISIHTPLAGSDLAAPSAEASNTIFQSTLPLRGATNARSREIAAILISIHTPLAGSDRRRRAGRQREHISIHTPLAGSDVRRGPVEPARQGISIHTPLAGSDLQIKGLSAGPLTFQSTLPLRGATCANSSTISPKTNFNPHSPCGERPTPHTSTTQQIDFNPHSPCGERHTPYPHGANKCIFQSTLPLRGATPATGGGQYTVKFQSTLPLRGATIH